MSNKYWEYYEANKEILHKIATFLCDMMNETGRYYDLHLCDKGEDLMEEAAYILKMVTKK